MPDRIDGLIQEVTLLKIKLNELAQKQEKLKESFENELFQVRASIAKLKRVPADPPPPPPDMEAEQEEEEVEVVRKQLPKKRAARKKSA